MRKVEHAQQHQPSKPLQQQQPSPPPPPPPPPPLDEEEEEPPPPPPPPPPFVQGAEAQPPHGEVSKPLAPPAPSPWYPRSMDKARAKFLYLYQPYDKSIWSKLQSPAHLMAMLVAAWPGWGVRACFFSLTLLCLLPEL